MPGGTRAPASRTPSTSPRGSDHGASIPRSSPRGCVRSATSPASWGCGSGSGSSPNASTCGCSASLACRARSGSRRAMGSTSLVSPTTRRGTAQLDLGVPEARAWILDRLTALIEEQGVDYLKWDSNFWINNNRPRAGRGARDGNFEHVRGLYAVLAELRARFPDAADRELFGRRQPHRSRADALHRRRLDGRSHLAVRARAPQPPGAVDVPPACLSAVVRDRPHATSRCATAPDMKTYARSRMPGMLGVSFRAGELERGRRSQRCCARSRCVEGQPRLERAASAVLLTAQANGPTSPGLGRARADLAGARPRLALRVSERPRQPGRHHRLRGLDTGASYGIRTSDGETLGTATGSALMTRGVRVPASPDSASQVLELVPAAAAVAPDP